MLSVSAVVRFDHAFFRRICVPLRTAGSWTLGKFELRSMGLPSRRGLRITT